MEGLRTSGRIRNISLYFGLFSPFQTFECLHEHEYSLTLYILASNNINQKTCLSLRNAYFRKYPSNSLHIFLSNAHPKIVDRLQSSTKLAKFEKSLFLKISLQFFHIFLSNTHSTISWHQITVVDKTCQNRET